MAINVIVIDDNLEIIQLMTELLNISNITVLATGRNGKDAVDLYVKLKPDITIMDLNMPEYDGLYGLENIKKADPHAKVIIISANKDFNVKKRLDKIEFLIFINKPFEVHQIIEGIHKLMLHEYQK